MDRNHDTRSFLAFLLDHENLCVAKNCPLCQTAQSIYELIRSRSLVPNRPTLDSWELPAKVQ